MLSLWQLGLWVFYLDVIPPATAEAAWCTLAHSDSVTVNEVRSNLNPEASPAVNHKIQLQRIGLEWKAEKIEAIEITKDSVIDYR